MFMSHAITAARMPLPTQLQQSVRETMNIILMSLPHAGSTVVAKMISMIGWWTDDCEQAYSERCEHKRLVQLNDSVNNHLRGLDVDLSGVSDDLDSYVAEMDSRASGGDFKGWIAKDPRWCNTIRYLKGIPGGKSLFGRPDVLLLYLERSCGDVQRSLKTRDQLVDGEPGIFGLGLDMLWSHAEEAYDEWLGPNKIRLSYEDVKSAVDIFDVTRNSYKHPDRGRAGWRSSRKGNRLG